MFVEPWDGRGQSSFAGRGRLPVRDVVRVMHAWTVQLGSARSGPDGNVAGQRPFPVPAGSGRYEGVRRGVAPAVAPVATRPIRSRWARSFPLAVLLGGPDVDSSSGDRHGRWTATVGSTNASLPRSKGCSATDGTRTRSPPWTGLPNAGGRGERQRPGDTRRTRQGSSRFTTLSVVRSPSRPPREGLMATNRDQTSQVASLSTRWEVGWEAW